VVLGIVALLLTLAVPRYFPSIDSAKETILADNLRNTRAVIDQFYADTGRYPDSLDQLVEKKYLRACRSTRSPTAPHLDPGAARRRQQGRVYGIRSGAPGNDRNGKPYSDW
jgi:general secretion pathway protein G